MDAVIALVFFILGFLLLALALLAILRTGFARLESSIGIQGDGLAEGKLAPGWSLPDLAGRLRVTPADDHWQMLIFADHSLASLVGGGKQASP